MCAARTAVFRWEDVAMGLTMMIVILCMFLAVAGGLKGARQ
jgi:hypothetical protein